MKRFKNVLVVVDEASVTDAVFARAEWLAKSNGATLTLIDILDHDPSELMRLFSALPGQRSQEVEEKLVITHQERLEKLAGRLRDAGAEVKTQVLHGTGFLQTIRTVLRGGHDLVLKGAHRGPDRPYLRATDLHLLRKCPCPVWILNGASLGRSQRILASVDPDPDDKIRDGLNHTVMELATSLSRNDGAALDVMNAWFVEEESSLRSLVRLPEREIDDILNSAETKSLARLSHLMADFTDFSDATRILHLKGVAADVIPEHVESERIDTLVMGTVGRTGISGFFIGNTAETILSRVSCSVLAVKPTGFVSPVGLEDEDNEL